MLENWIDCEVPELTTINLYLLSFGQEFGQFEEKGGNLYTY
jgi:hypothetical protein